MPPVHCHPITQNSLAARQDEILSEGRSLEGGAHPHLVQFYKDDAFLAENVARFLHAGLVKGEGAVVIAKPGNLRGISEALRMLGLPPEDLKAHGQLRMLDAASALSTFMVDGQPDPEKFRQEIGGVVRQIGDAFGNVRAYGEMVGILWDAGNATATHSLEALWNGLYETHSFSLLCGYSLSSFSDHSHAEGFRHICEAHSNVFPSEEQLRARDSDEQLKQIALLEQRAQALKAELEKRTLLEAQLRANLNDLQQALHSRDELMSICSHELKTPLSALTLQTGIAMRRMIKGDDSLFHPEKVRKFVKDYGTQVKRLVLLVDDMLDLTRINSGKLTLNREEVNLSLLIDEVLERFSEQLRIANCAVTVRTAPMLLGYWDRFRIEQVVINLLTNAMKYGAGKPIEIHTAQTEAGSIQMSFRDYGFGIAAEDQGRIFQRFERAVSANEVSGLGLGLFIAKQIVLAHSGDISLRSELGAGSTFTVELPGDLNDR